MSSTGLERWGRGVPWVGKGQQEAIYNLCSCTPSSCLHLHMLRYPVFLPSSLPPSVSMSPLAPLLPVMYLFTSQPPFRVTHILDPVDLWRGLGVSFTGQGHSTTKSYCSTFRLHHQLDLVQRHRLWGWEGA